MDLLAQKLYNERFFPVLPRFFKIVIGFLREKIVRREWWTLGKTNAMTQQCHFKLTQICFLYSCVPDIVQILSSSFYAYQQHILEMLSKGSAFFSLGEKWRSQRTEALTQTCWEENFLHFSQWITLFKIHVAILEDYRVFFLSRATVYNIKVIQAGGSTPVIFGDCR